MKKFTASQEEAIKKALLDADVHKDDKKQQISRIDFVADEKKGTVTIEVRGGASKDID